MKKDLDITLTNKKYKMSILKKDLISIFLWMVISIIMLKPESLEYFEEALFDTPLFDMLLDFLKVLISIGCIVAFLIIKKKSKFFVFAVANKILACIITIFYGGDMRYAFICAAMEFVFVSMIYWGCSNKNIICALYYVLTLFCIINFITIILYPEGMYSTQEIGWEKNWFLGYKTILPLYVVSESALAFLFYHNTRKVRHIIIFFITVIQPFMEGSAGAIISSIVLIGGFMISMSKMEKIKKLMNIWLIFIGYVAGSFLLIVNNITMKYNFEFIVLLGKDSTLTTRTAVLWPVNVAAFLKRPVWGYGYLKQREYTAILGAHRAHNILLGIMVSSGIVGLIVFICFILYLHKATKKYIGTRAYGFCASCFGALFTAGLIEAYDNIGIASIVYAILYFLPALFKEYSDTNVFNEESDVK